MKWLETIALHFGTCYHSTSFNNIELFNKKMLIHLTVLDIQTKKYLLLYKVTIKNPPYGDKDSTNADINTNTKRKLIFRVGYKKKIGLGIQSFFCKEDGRLVFCRGGFRGNLDVQKYRHTEREGVGNIDHSKRGTVNKFQL